MKPRKNNAGTLAPAHPSSVAAEIATLQDTTVAELRVRWQQRWRATAPPVQSADILARLMAWRVQVEAYGDLDREIRQRIDDLGRRLAEGRPFLPNLSEALPAGTVLTREWRGRRHSVTSVEGGYTHEGQTYATLSEVARAITGTRWSGPRFFGLKGAKSPKATPRPSPSS